MKKFLTGKVISTKMAKTVTVQVERKLRHGRYKKVIIRHKKYKAHVVDLDLKIGDSVQIEATRPISKDKHFRVVKKI
ncbi:30S ribosomal protein S17 [Candidatus Roizmanbacteria bacterium RIFCSPLOWO2_01_FULL_44_13]|uniref:Small ribosomal subunit protein uS17 n=1 Tax=Candidatus Roizmanbacteria bacterium RIFCSPLOWO2_01_FULL_44_13 TaxID=1802069 RepID=A0A1F7J9N0_9BACT|nr:MAG: 30S ribosomal protein S17 [Candidatus Roizmanbacteria bacterium RIFCSPLOWO2_01_FULL_44_13]